MIGTIRKHQQWLWGIIILAIIISFVVYFSPNSTSILEKEASYNFGTINNRPITREEYRNAYAESQLLYFMRSGNKWPEREEAEGPAFQSSIYNRIALIEKMKELNVEPTIEATAKWIADIFQGPNDKTFPMDRYQNFVKTELTPRNLTSDDFYRFARHQLAQEHLISVIGLSGKLITPQEGESFYRRMNEPLVTEAVIFSATNFLGSVNPTPAALGEFFTNNMAEYRLPERIQVTYVKWGLSNYLAEADKELAKITNLSQQIDAAYLRAGTNIFKDEAGNPLPIQEAKAKIREEERKRLAMVNAQRQANEFLTELYDAHDEKNPLKPEDLEKAAKAKGLDVQITPPFDLLTGAEQLKMPAQFVQATFRMRNADMEESVKGVATEEGAFAVALHKRFPSENQPFEKVRDQVAKDFREREAMRLARQAGNNFERTLTNSIAQGKTFDAIAAEAKVPVKKLPTFSLSTTTLPGIDEEIRLEMLQGVANTLTPGKASGFVPTNDGGLILYLREKLPVDESLMKKDLPEFLARQREQRMQAAFFDWYQNLAKEMKLSPPMKSSSGDAG